MANGFVIALVMRGLASAVRRAIANRPPSLTQPRPGPAVASPREGDERWMRLSSANGVDCWLDLQTGELSEWTAPEPSAPQGLMALACAAFDEANMRYHQNAAGGVLLLLGRSHARYVVDFRADDALRQFDCAMLHAAMIPEDRHAETLELCERLNALKGPGTYGLDEEDGTVTVHLCWTVVGDYAPPERIRDTVFEVARLAEWSHDAFMRVGFGGMTADEVLGWEGEP